MVMDNSLDAIKEKWEKVVDYCVIMAVSTDFKAYPTEVQKVIITEFKKRGLKAVA
jgi:hypothetical protein